LQVKNQVNPNRWLQCYC